MLDLEEAVLSAKWMNCVFHFALCTGIAVRRAG